MKLKIAIVGAGRIVDWLLTDVKNSKYAKDIQLIGIWNHHLEKAQLKQKKYHIQKVYLSFEELINDHQNYDIVYVATNDTTHYQFVKPLLLNKINVFVEKPIALDYHQTIELYQIAKKNRVLLFEGIKTGFSPAYIAMKKIIKQGIIGDLTFVHSTHAKVSTSGKIPNPQATDNVAGFHLAGGMYALFITLDLLDSPKTISFLNNSYPNNKAISTSVLNMRHSNNAISSVLGSDAFTDNLTSKICGTKGCIILGGNLKKYHKNYLRDSCHFAYTYSLYDNLGNFIKSEEIPVKTNGEGLCKEIDHVYELLKEHRLESNIVTPKISIMISKILSLTNKVDDTKVIKFLWK